jgi:radical SAM protein with 4Fe4S-binding SPASM domain
VSTAPMIERYPVLRDAVEIHLSRENSSVLDTGGGIRVGAADFRPFDRIVTDPGAARYLSLCDGTRSHRQIHDSLFSQGSSFIAEMFSEEILLDAERAGLLTVHDRAMPAAKPIKVTGTTAGYHPLHISYELSEGCNFRCDHCYVSSGPELKGRLPLERVTAMFDTFADRGVRLIEITGGECTIHPQFPEVLAHATDVFNLVAIITNGYLLGTNRRVQEAVAAHSNLVVQVSIDGLRENHDRFRKHRGAFDAAVEAIRFAKSVGRRVRMACSCSTPMLDDIPGLFELAEELDVDIVVFAPVSGFGRGCDIADSTDDHQLYHEVLTRLLPFRDRPLSKRAEVPENNEEGDHNCGAGWRSFAVNWRGDVRSCLFLSDSKQFGNVFSDDWNGIFGQDDMHLFRNAPRPGGPDCEGCAHYNTCKGCFAKAFMISESRYPQCPWRKRWFGDMTLAPPPAAAQPVLLTIGRRPGMAPPA